MAGTRLRALAMHSNQSIQTSHERMERERAMHGVVCCACLPLRRMARVDSERQTTDDDGRVRKQREQQAEQQSRQGGPLCALLSVRAGLAAALKASTRQHRRSVRRSEERRCNGRGGQGRREWLYACGLQLRIASRGVRQQLARQQSGQKRRFANTADDSVTG